MRYAVRHTMRHLVINIPELAQIPRDVRDPVFIAARKRRVKILRTLSVSHYQAVLFSQFVNRTNDRLDAQGTPPGINYQRNW